MRVEAAATEMASLLFVRTSYVAPTTVAAFMLFCEPVVSENCVDRLDVDSARGSFSLAPCGAVRVA